MRKKKIVTRSRKQSAEGSRQKRLPHHSADTKPARSYLEPVGPRVPSWIANTKNGKPGSDQEFVQRIRNIFFQYYFPIELSPRLALLPETIEKKDPKKIHREIIAINEFKYEGALQKLVLAIFEADTNYLQRLANGAKEIRKAQDKLCHHPSFYLWIAYTRYLVEHSKAPTYAECRELAKRLWAIDRLREWEKYIVPDKPSEADERRIQRVKAQLPATNWYRAYRTINLRLKPAKSGPKTRTG